MIISIKEKTERIVPIKSQIKSTCPTGHYTIRPAASAIFRATFTHRRGARPPPTPAHLENQLAEVLRAEGVRVPVVQVVRLLDGVPVQTIGELERLGRLLAQAVELDTLQLVQFGAYFGVDYV